MFRGEEWKRRERKADTDGQEKRGDEIKLFAKLSYFLVRPKAKTGESAAVVDDGGDGAAEAAPFD